MGGLTGKSYRGDIRITVKEIEVSLRTSKWGNLEISFLDVLSHYQGKPLITRTQEEEESHRGQARYFRGYISSPPMKTIVLEILSRRDTRFLRAYRDRMDELSDSMQVLEKVYKSFPLQGSIYIASLAHDVTGDPHALDLDNLTGELFLHSLRLLYEAEHKKMIDLAKREDVHKVYNTYGVVRDDLLNFATVYGISGISHDGRESSMLKGAMEDGNILHLPLREVLRFSRMRARGSVYIVENSTVSALLLDGIENLPISLVVGGGQLNLATLAVLDLLAKEGIEFHYAGDYDPEGLRLAQRVLDRYSTATPWMYHVENYHRIMRKELESSARLKQLDGITQPELIPLAQEMKVHRKVGYQEALVEEMIQDVRKRHG
ncbi:DUF2399 domain-containing protein [Bacillus thuringiensis]|uniref:DUF2399 domain-containing protein n=1 Tax=Bacillus thuringiensis TaxID=1428 RepID=UPI0037F88697